jgi:hypothetical protein
MWSLVYDERFTVRRDSPMTREPPTCPNHMLVTAPTAGSVDMYIACAITSNVSRSCAALSLLVLHDLFEAYAT